MLQRNVATLRNFSGRSDVLSAIGIAQSAIAGPPTKERRTVTGLAFSIASQNKSFKDDEASTIASSLATLSALADLQSRLTAVCDCCFLYWHRVMVGVRLKSVYESKTEVNRLHVSIRGQFVS